MRIKNVLLLASFAVLTIAAPAFAASSVLGRISYIYPEGNRLILDSKKDYDIASGVGMANHGVAEFVRLSLDAGGKVTAISPGPAAQAGYWTARAGDDS